MTMSSHNGKFNGGIYLKTKPHGKTSSSSNQPFQAFTTEHSRNGDRIKLLVEKNHLKEGGIISTLILMGEQKGTAKMQGTSQMKNGRPRTLYTCFHLAFIIV
jgi:hypothetical protein